MKKICIFILMLFLSSLAFSKTEAKVSPKGLGIGYNTEDLYIIIIDTTIISGKYKPLGTKLVIDDFPSLQPLLVVRDMLLREGNNGLAYNWILICLENNKGEYKYNSKADEYYYWISFDDFSRLKY